MSERGHVCPRGCCLFTRKMTDHFLKRFEPHRVLIQTRNQGKFCSTRIDKSLPATQADFLEGLEAIGNKSRAHYEKLSNTALRQFREFKIGVRFQPRLTPKT